MFVHHCPRWARLARLRVFLCACASCDAAHPPPCLDLSTLQEYPHLAVTQPQRLPLLPLLCAFSSSILPVCLCTHESEQPLPACLPRSENGHLDDAQCEAGVSPSEPTIARNSSNDLANAFEAAHDKIARHHDLQACCPLTRNARLVPGLHPPTPPWQLSRAMQQITRRVFLEALHLLDSSSSIGEVIAARLVRNETRARKLFLLFAQVVSVQTATWRID